MTFIRESFKDGFALYIINHRNTVNRIIHYVGIPICIFLVFCIINYIPLKINVTTEMYEIFNFNIINLVLLILITIVYMMVDSLAGFFFGLILMFLIFVANLCVYDVPYFWIPIMCTSLITILVMYIGCDIEKAGTGILRKICEVLVIGPFFIFLELLFLCGYNIKLQNDIWSRCEIYETIV